MKMATEKQVEFCRTLFRKTKMYYQCCETDQDLRNEVLERTGYDLNELEASEAEAIIGRLKQELDKRPGAKWRRRR